MLRWILLVLALSGAAAQAAAGSFSVNPVRVNLAADQRVVALTVRNNGSSPVRVQAQLMRWFAMGNEDAYESSNELLVSPPIFALEPGAAQIVRVGLRTSRLLERENTFRLYLTELPGQLGPDFRGLAMTLRLGVPIFVQPTNTVQPVLSGSLNHTSQGLQIDVSNAGSAHARLIEAELLDSSDQLLGKVALSRDVLSDQHRTLLVQSTHMQPTATRLRIRVDPSSADFVLPLPVR